MINTLIVGDSQYPRKEFAFFIVLTGLDGINDFDENILENIIRKTFIFYHHHDGGKNSVLVAIQQQLK